jgi:hypothetical protein
MSGVHRPRDPRSRDGEGDSIDARSRGSPDNLGGPCRGRFLWVLESNHRLRASFRSSGAFRVGTPPLETEVGRSGTVVAIAASFVSALLTEPLQVSRRTAFVRRSRSPVDEETLQQKRKRSLPPARQQTCRTDDPLVNLCAAPLIVRLGRPGPHVLTAPASKKLAPQTESVRLKLLASRATARRCSYAGFGPDSESRAR